MRTSMHARIHTPTLTYAHARAHTHTHARTHTRMHTRTPRLHKLEAQEQARQNLAQRARAVSVEEEDAGGGWDDDNKEGSEASPRGKAGEEGVAYSCAACVRFCVCTRACERYQCVCVCVFVCLHALVFTCA